jgi:hypothetical protein
VVSYLIGGLACLAMPCGDRGRRFWLVASTALFTMAIWSHLVAVPLVAVCLVAYVVLRAMRDRRRLGSDLVLMGCVGVAVTVALSVASGIEIGQFNFISPTWHTYRYLDTPAQESIWHTKGWSWVAYLPYLLVPPAVVGAWMAVFGRRLRSIPTPQLLIGLVCAGQILVFAWLQFFGTVQTLEQQYFSSTLWASVCITLAITLAEASRPFFDRPRALPWFPAVLVLAVPLIYEVAPKVPTFTWGTFGAPLAIALVAGGVVSRFESVSKSRATAMTRSALGIVVIVACALYLTAVPLRPDPHLDVRLDPTPSYSTALGTTGAEELDVYRVATELPRFVGNATYKNEQLLTWVPRSEQESLTSVFGMYHSNFNLLPSSPPTVTTNAVAMLNARRPAEVLLLNTQNVDPSPSLIALRAFRPVLMRATALRSGGFVVYAWLIHLRVFGPAR